MFPTFRTLKLLYDKVHSENSLAVVSVEYKIPEVCCHYRRLMVFWGMETSDNTRHDFEENGSGTVGF